MATEIPVIDADGHIMEQQSEVRKYLDDRWKGRDGQLWPRASWNCPMATPTR
jgi:hypothetical protein